MHDSEMVIFSTNPAWMGSDIDDTEKRGLSLPCKYS
jgi:hypothetical protein